MPFMVVVRSSVVRPAFSMNKLAKSWQVAEGWVPWSLDGTVFSKPLPTLTSIWAPYGPSWIVVPVGVVNVLHGVMSADLHAPPTEASAPPSTRKVIGIVVEPPSAPLGLTAPPLLPVGTPLLPEELPVPLEPLPLLLSLPPLDDPPLPPPVALMGDPPVFGAELLLPQPASPATRQSL